MMFRLRWVITWETWSKVRKKSSQNKSLIAFVGNIGLVLPSNYESVWL